MAKRIAVLTGGGDCPGLNAVLRAVVKTASSRHWSVLGVVDGFEGFLRPEAAGLRRLAPADVRGILPRGGTILGTTNRGNPFAYRMVEDGVEREVDRSGEILKIVRSLELEALLVIGGDGTLRIALELGQLGAPVVGIPKTIDNDLDATEVTFGFDTALATATEAIDKLHTTAESHHRVMIVEVMGRGAGWIAIQAGIAGGGDLILIPEIPFTVEAIAQDIERRRSLGRQFSIVVAAEGATPVGGEPIFQRTRAGQPARLGGIGSWLAEELGNRLDHEVRSTVLGYLQRGGSPTARDRLLASRYGARAVELVAEGLLGHMVALQCDRITAVRLEDAVSKPKRVDPEGELVRTARELGISFGDDVR